MSGTLDQIGLELGVDQSSRWHDHLRKYERHLGDAGDPRTIAVLAAKQPMRTGAVFARRYPNSRVIVFSLIRDPERAEFVGQFRNLEEREGLTGEQIGEVLEELWDLDLLIDDGHHRKSEKRRYFEDFFLYLADGGVYVVEDLHALGIDRFIDEDGPDVVARVVNLTMAGSHQISLRKLSHGERVLSRAVARVSLYPRIAFIERQGALWRKVAEDEDLGAVVADRGIEGVFTETVLDGFAYDAPSAVSVNRLDLLHRFRREYRQPDLKLRTYENVDVEPRQLVYRRGIYFPETFRLYRQRSPHHSLISSVSKTLALGRSGVATSGPVLNGTFFYLDTEHPATYGHLITEVVGRLWGWTRALERYPDLRALVSAPSGESDIKPWFREMLVAAGIPSSRIQVITGPVRVEKLIGVTPLFSNPVVAHPALGSTWDSLGLALMESGSDLPNFEKVFVSRRPGTRRQCHNGADVEAYFAQRGFEVVYPEDFTLSQQVALFRNAGLVAGYGGSALINTIFCRPEVPRIVIAPEGYNAMNEYMIATVHRAPVTYIWCRADRNHPPGTWSEEAFLSDFTFDFDRDEPLLERALEHVSRS